MKVWMHLLQGGLGGLWGLLCDEMRLAVVVVACGTVVAVVLGC